MPPRWRTESRASTRRRIEALIREHGYRKIEKSEAVPIVEVVFQALDSPWDDLLCCHAARAAGLAIPGDLSVVGFDDLPLTQWPDPPLTTVHQPLARMGATAAEFVLALAAGRTIDHDRLERPTKLVVRGSTAPPA